MEPEMMKIIGDIPTSWDNSIALAGELGKYMVVARLKGNDWYIGAIGDWDHRDITIDLSFLDEGNYSAAIYQDGINADKYAEDYKVVEKNVVRNDSLSFHLAPGGGWLVKLSKK